MGREVRIEGGGECVGSCWSMVVCMCNIIMECTVPLVCLTPDCMYVCVYMGEGGVGVGRCVWCGCVQMCVYVDVWALV